MRHSDCFRGPAVFLPCQKPLARSDRNSHTGETISDRRAKDPEALRGERSDVENRRNRPQKSKLIRKNRRKMANGLPKIRHRPSTAYSALAYPAEAGQVRRAEYLVIVARFYFSFLFPYHNHCKIPRTANIGHAIKLRRK